MTHLWEVVDVATSSLKASAQVRPRSNPHDMSESSNDPATTTMSLPSSPVVKDLPTKLGLDSKPKPHPNPMDRKLSASLLERSGSSGGSKSSVVAKMHFLDGFRHTLRPRTKSDDLGDDGTFFKMDATPSTTATSSTTATTRTVVTTATTKPSLETSLSSGGSGSASPSDKVGTGLIRRWSETTSTSKTPSTDHVRLRQITPTEF
jgi:hypothetical protein